MLQGSAGDLKVHCLRAFAAAIRLGIVGNFLVFGQDREARGLAGGEVDKNVGTALVRLDKAEAFISVEEFYGASIGHGVIPFPRRSYIERHPHSAGRFRLRKGPTIVVGGGCPSPPTRSLLRIRRAFLW